MRGTVPSAAGRQRAVPCVRQKGGPHGGKPFALPRGGRWPKTCPDCRVPKRNRGQGPRGQYFGDKAPAPTSAAKAEKAAPPRRRTKGKGPGGALGALLADLDKENARRGKKGLPPLSYGKYVQLFGR